MRGFGVNQVTFAMESCVDDLCEQGGFDRWQSRYDNAIKDGDTTATVQMIRQGAGVRETLKAVKSIFNNSEFAGIACGIKNTGSYTRACIKIYTRRLRKLTIRLTKSGGMIYEILSCG